MRLPFQLRQPSVQPKSDSGSGSGFHKILTPVPDPGPKKTHNLAGVYSGAPDQWPPLVKGSSSPVVLPSVSIRKQCNIQCENSRVAHGPCKRKLSPQTPRNTPKGVQKPRINETELIVQ